MNFDNMSFELDADQLSPGLAGLSSEELFDWKELQEKKEVKIEQNEFVQQLYREQYALQVSIPVNPGAVQTKQESLMLSEETTCMAYRTDMGDFPVQEETAYRGNENAPTYIDMDAFGSGKGEQRGDSFEPQQYADMEIYHQPYPQSDQIFPNNATENPGFVSQIHGQPRYIYMNNSNGFVEASSPTTSICGVPEEKPSNTGAKPRGNTKKGKVKDPENIELKTNISILEKKKSAQGLTKKEEEQLLRFRNNLSCRESRELKNNKIMKTEKELKVLREKEHLYTEILKELLQRDDMPVQLKNLIRVKLTGGNTVQ